MTPTRRQILAAAGAAAGFAPFAAASKSARIDAIGFDAFTIFDPRSLDAAIETHLPGRGRGFGVAWRARIFDYCWLRTLTGAYADFERIADDALTVTAGGGKIDLSPKARTEILAGLKTLAPWPDSAAALKTMRDAGLRLACVSNFTQAMLRENVAGAGLEALFEHLVSTDDTKGY